MAEWLGLIVVVTIGLVAANTASMSIRERRGEIALMRSLGFPSQSILWMLLAESAAIAILGGIIGCSGALLLVNGARLGGLGPLSTIRMPPLVLAEAMLIAVGIGFVSAWFPARSAARRNIVDTLRAIWSPILAACAVRSSFSTTQLWIERRHLFRSVQLSAARSQFRKIRMPEGIAGLECFRKLEKHRAGFVRRSAAISANFVAYGFGTRSVDRIVAEETQ